MIKTNESITRIILQQRKTFGTITKSCFSKGWVAHHSNGYSSPVHKKELRRTDNLSPEQLCLSSESNSMNMLFCCCLVSFVWLSSAWLCFAASQLKHHRCKTDSASPAAASLRPPPWRTHELNILTEKAGSRSTKPARVVKMWHKAH